MQSKIRSIQNDLPPSLSVIEQRPARTPDTDKKLMAFKMRMFASQFLRRHVEHDKVSPWREGQIPIELADRKRTTQIGDAQHPVKSRRSHAKIEDRFLVATGIVGPTTSGSPQPSLRPATRPSVYPTICAGLPCTIALGGTELRTTLPGKHMTTPAEFNAGSYYRPRRNLCADANNRPFWSLTGKHHSRPNFGSGFNRDVVSKNSTSPNIDPAPVRDAPDGTIKSSGRFQHSYFSLYSIILNRKI